MTSLITQLETTRDQTLEFYTLGDDDLAKTYGPGKWSVRFILLHLADTETVFIDRIHRILSEPRPLLRGSAIASHLRMRTRVIFSSS